MTFILAHVYTLPDNDSKFSSALFSYIHTHSRTYPLKQFSYYEKGERPSPLSNQNAKEPSKQSTGGTATKAIPIDQFIFLIDSWEPKRTRAA